MNEVRSFSSILVGDDGSEASRAAFTAALALAQCLQAKLLLLGIEEPPAPTEEAEGWGLDKLDKSREHMREQLARDAEHARGLGLEIVADVVSGEVKDAIKTYVAEHAIDLLILGHHHLSRPQRWLTNSTSEELAATLSVSVLMVHSEKS